MKSNDIDAMIEKSDVNTQILNTLMDCGGGGRVLKIKIHRSLFLEQFYPNNKLIVLNSL